MSVIERFPHIKYIKMSPSPRNCPLFKGVRYFGVSANGGFTVSNICGLWAEDPSCRQIKNEEALFSS